MLMVWYRHSLGIAGGGRSKVKFLIGKYKIDCVSGKCNTEADMSILDSSPIDEYEERCFCFSWLIPSEDRNISWNFRDEELDLRKDTIAAGNTYKAFIIFGSFLMVVGFFIGINVAGLAIGFSVIFMCTRTIVSSRAKAKRSNEPLIDTDTEKYLNSVDWTLIILFAGLFIMISATVQTGYPNDFFRAIFESCIDDPASKCPVTFTIMLTVFSNVINNVPFVLLIKGYIVRNIEQGIVSRKNWLLISWVCTMAGNFMLMGSASNLIVADQARQAGQDVFTTINHGKFGIPSTIACIAVGVPVLIKTMK